MRKSNKENFSYKDPQSEEYIQILHQPVLHMDAYMELPYQTLVLLSVTQSVDRPAITWMTNGYSTLEV